MAPIILRSEVPTVDQAFPFWRTAKVTSVKSFPGTFAVSANKLSLVLISINGFASVIASFELGWNWLSALRTTQLLGGSVKLTLV